MTEEKDTPALPTPEDDYRNWEKLVRERCREQCQNCGGGDHLRIQMIVPLAAGGKLNPTNGTMLCRACEMAADSVSTQSTGDQRLVNFWVSEALFNRIKTGLETYNTYNSMGALVRYLMSKFVSSPERFEDLSLFQDEGSATKINVWSDKATYAAFKAILDTKGWTVTSTLKSLLVLYSVTAEDMILPTNSNGGDA